MARVLESLRSRSNWYSSSGRPHTSTIAFGMRSPVTDERRVPLPPQRTAAWMTGVVGMGQRLKGVYHLLQDKIYLYDKVGRELKKVNPQAGKIKLTLTPDPMYLEGAFEVHGGSIPPPYEERYN